MNRFIVTEVPEEGIEVSLSDDESHHLATVLRVKAGEEVLVVDGKGGLARAIVVTASAKGSRLRIEEKREAGPPSRVSVVFGVPKPPALEFILRRCAEVGVASLQPLWTERSQRFNSWNGGRWEKILREVAKQCEAVHFAALPKPLELQTWLGARESSRRLALCDETARGSGGTLSGAGEWDLLVGPEGGWSPSELAAFRERGAVSFGLGRQRLRTETAALVGLAFLKRAIGEM